MAAIEYKCPNCGASLLFMAESQRFECEFCGSNYSDSEIKEMFSQHEETALDEEKRKLEEEFIDQTKLYTCQNCGSEIIADENTAATFCLYCHGPVILSNRVSGELRPTKIIPFNTTKDQAIENYKKWCGKKVFVPPSFKANTTIEKIEGIYIPYWVATCDIKGDVTAQANIKRTWRSGDYIHTEIREYQILRSANGQYCRIPADASKKADDKLMESIEPYDYTKLEDFSMSFLSGHLADKYDVEHTIVFPRIRERVLAATNTDIRNSIIGYSDVRYTKNSMTVKKTDWEYMLLPVWFLTYHYKDKRYYFAMNGQTGKVNGLLPLYKGKLFAYAAGICAAIVGITSIIFGIGLL